MKRKSKGSRKASNRGEIILKPKSGVSKTAFYENLRLTLKKLKNSSTNYLTPTKYKNIIRQVQSAKKKKSPVKDKNGKLLAKFDIVKEKNSERLIVPKAKKSSNNVYYITKNELFDILEDAHINTSHGDRAVMLQYLNEKYKNITRDSVNIYLRLCTTCSKKKANERLERATQRMETPKLPPKPNNENATGVIGLLSMEDIPDGNYYYILVYRDKKTKFIHLQPLEKNVRPKDLAFALKKIFTPFGAPIAIHSMDEDFFIEALKELNAILDETDIKHEKLEIIEPLDDVRDLILTWLLRRNTTKWVDGLRFIQYIKNLIYDEELAQSPFEAMFGRKGKLDVNSLNLPEEIIETIRHEFEDDDEEDKGIEINEMLEVIVQEDVDPDEEKSQNS